MKINKLNIPKNILGESPVWDEKEETLIWSDIDAKKVNIYNFQSKNYKEIELHEKVGCLALHESGKIVVALESEIGFLDSNKYTTIQKLEEDIYENRFNECSCDAEGRLWFGSMSTKGEASIYKMDINGKITKEISSLYTVNGMAFSPDGRTFMYSDSHPSVQDIWKCSYDSKSGRIIGKKKFFNTSKEDFRPDGAMFDVNSGYWVAGIDSGCLVRFDLSKGAILDKLKMPSSLVTKSCFVGKGLDTIAVTSKKGDDMELSGSLYYFKSNYKGLLTNLCKVNLERKI